MPEPPIINIIFHVAVFITGIVAVFIGIGLWYNRTLNHLAISLYWRIFMAGIIFYTISEFVDIFTPGLRASLGVQNYLVESTLVVGLALIFVSLFRFMRDYTEKTSENKK